MDEQRVKQLSAWIADNQTLGWDQIQDAASKVGYTPEETIAAYQKFQSSLMELTTSSTPIPEDKPTTPESKRHFPMLFILIGMIILLASLVIFQVVTQFNVSNPQSNVPAVGNN